MATPQPANEPSFSFFSPPGDPEVPQLAPGGPKVSIFHDFHPFLEGFGSISSIIPTLFPLRSTHTLCKKNIKIGEHSVPLITEKKELRRNPSTHIPTNPTSEARWRGWPAGHLDIYIEREREISHKHIDSQLSDSITLGEIPN